jgi:hypothetical protein
MSLVELLGVFAIALLVVGASVAAMAVGVMFKRPCLRGSCGGPSVLGRRGEKLSCTRCPNRRHGAEPVAPAAPADD